MTLHRIAAANAYDQTGRLVVQFTDGHQPVIDLSQFLAPGEALAPLRYPERFEALEIGADGHTVFWRLAEEIVELSADRCGCWPASSAPRPAARERKTATARRHCNRPRVGSGCGAAWRRRRRRAPLSLPDRGRGDRCDLCRRALVKTLAL
jgi:hypothetical protein